jgi:hypothetical protein
VSSTHSVKSKSSVSKVSLPASILEKSRMSLRTVRSASALLRIVSANSRWSSANRVSSRRLLMPITPFIGVRISWLMLARKALFALVFDSAASRARSSSVSSCLRSLMSRTTPKR